MKGVELSGWTADMKKKKKPFFVNSHFFAGYHVFLSGHNSDFRI